MDGSEVCPNVSVAKHRKFCPLPHRLCMLCRKNGPSTSASINTCQGDPQLYLHGRLRSPVGTTSVRLCVEKPLSAFSHIRQSCELKTNTLPGEATQKQTGLACSAIICQRQAEEFQSTEVVGIRETTYTASCIHPFPDNPSVRRRCPCFSKTRSRRCKHFDILAQLDIVAYK